MLCVGGSNTRVILMGVRDVQITYIAYLPPIRLVGGQGSYPPVRYTTEGHKYLGVTML